MKNKYLTIDKVIEDDILTITLNRPEKRNALNDVLVAELRELLEEVNHSNDIRVVILTGAGSCFCSGADLEYLSKMQHFNEKENLKDSQQLTELFYLIYTLSKPVIADVNGPAIAGGAGLAIVCDIILANQNATFGFPEVKIGFVPAIVSAFLIKQIGERKARELMISGSIITSDEAQMFGLINKVYDDEKTRNELLDNYINNLLNASSTSISETKQIICSTPDIGFKKTLLENAKKNARFRQNIDFKEGISSFLNKRKPNWIKNQGR